MITLKIYNKKWQIHIGDEIWQFDKTKEFAEVLESLLIYKENFGKFGDLKK